MSKVTSKLQVSVPKALADQYHISPGDDVEWQAAGNTLRVIPPGAQVPDRDRGERLELFDQTTVRQNRRQEERSLSTAAQGRGWTRADLYELDGGTD